MKLFLGTLVCIAEQYMKVLSVSMPVTYSKICFW